MSNDYLVSARKYRPSTFRSVVGQHTLTTTLKNAIMTDRLAQAYLFCGPRGVGKTSCARIFAKTINCTNRTPDGEACNECDSCRAFNSGQSINVVELDAASNNSVDNIRSLNEQTRIPPREGRYRVFIIDEVHMLSLGAFNAFLKTLEEPPSYVIFILATTEKHKVIPTILSRCQIYDFNRIGVQDMSEHLAWVAQNEGIRAEARALDVIARKADGAMRDALSIFDQVAACSQGSITYTHTIENLNVLDYDYHFRLVDAFLRSDVPEALNIYKEIRDAGFDSLQFINSLGTHLRNLLVAVTPQTLPLLEVSADVAQEYARQAAAIKPKWAYTALECVNYCDLNYKLSGNKQLLVELTLIRLCQLSDPTGATEFKGVPSLPVLRQPLAVKDTANEASLASGRNVAPATLQAHPGTPTSIPDSQPAAPRPVRNTRSVSPPPSGASSRFRISDLTALGGHGVAPAKSESPKADKETKQVHTDAPAQAVTADAGVLAKAWERFAEEHPSLPLVGAAMRTCPPVLQEDGTVSVSLESDLQRGTFEENMGVLLPWLRHQTGVPDLRLTFKVAPRGPRPLALTPAEMLQKTLGEYPHLNSLLDKLGASML